MKSHFDHLNEIIPNLEQRFILDLGSGRGRFLVDLAKRNVRSIGLELNEGYIDRSLLLAKENNVQINVIKGIGESLPFNDHNFDFVNVCEVFEHVNNPSKMMLEVHRVLKNDGYAYVSVPNRFGFKDPHFNLYFVNWIPRVLSDLFIAIFKKHKNYTKDAGLQRLKEMHYKTYKQAKKVFEKCGFQVFDIREIKIKNRFKNIFIRKIILSAYRFLRFFYFDSFHFKLYKTSL